MTTGGYKSCLDLQQRANIKSDGEYQMMLGGKNVSIYCHQMNTTWPKEFLTLPIGEAEKESLETATVWTIARKESSAST